MEPSANFQGDAKSAPGRRTTPGPMASESCVLRTPQSAVSTARLPSAVEAGQPGRPLLTRQSLEKSGKRLFNNQKNNT